MKLPYIIKKPIITERSLAAASNQEYTFEVDLTATKGQIKHAIQTYFEVDVVSVRTIRTKGKTKRAGKLRKPTQKSDKKKAIIKIKKDQKISLFDTQE